MFYRIFNIVAGAFLLNSIIACSPGSSTQTKESMELFSSQAEFAAYMEDIEDNSGGWWGNGNGDVVSDSAGEGARENENITNNQEDGVDEGGIVKNIGEHLVVLRQGRIYAVSVAASGDPVQTDSIRVAPDESLNRSVWYDEMLVRGSNIFVIGYRYIHRVRHQIIPSETYWWIHGATEVSHFILNDSGSLERGETLFFESADYYSGRNYASRMVGSQLMFYMPYYAFVYNYNSDEGRRNRHLRVPRFLHYAGDGEFIGGAPLFEGTDVFKPLTTPESPTFHTVISCNIESGFDCNSRSVLGNWSREFYVSPENIFIWTNPYIVAFSQDTLMASAHSVIGNPADQFSFREENGILHVGVRINDQEWPSDIDDNDEGDESSENNSMRYIALLSLPLGDFDSQGMQHISGGHLTSLMESEGWIWINHNRHTEGWYLAGTQISAGTGILVAHHIASNTTVLTDLEDLRVNRIEGMRGFGALVSASSGTWDERDLELIPIRLNNNGTAIVEDGLVLEGLGEGESRSHGFFFRPTETGGFFGLPVLGSGGGGHWWGRGVSNIAFFNVYAGIQNPLLLNSGNETLSFLGAISASDESGGSCETSCVDWYGNTRPIFLGNRVFALMGSELVEVEICNVSGTASPLGTPMIMQIR